MRVQYGGVVFLGFPNNIFVLLICKKCVVCAI